MYRISIQDYLSIDTELAFLGAIFTVYIYMTKANIAILRFFFIHNCKSKGNIVTIDSQLNATN